LFLYSQLYAMPLVLMFILSAITVYRREMSCNRVYALQDVPLATLVRGANVAPSAASNATASTVEDDMDNNNLRPLGKGIASSSDTTDAELKIAQHRSFCPPQLTDKTAAADPIRKPAKKNEWHVAKEHAKEIMKVIKNDLIHLNWTEGSTETINRACEGLYDFAYHKIEGVISLVIPKHRKAKTSEPTSLHLDQFPPDVQVNILSFLHPKDVVNFASASKECEQIIEGEGPTTKAIWKTLWQRDYGWIIHSWEIGRQAYARSNILEPEFGKDFYFRFGLGYLNYLLAGLNIPEKCLVAVHGNIYDITEFVVRHPGSPETLYVHAGKDASRFFDDMDHSTVARSLAREFCIAVDVSYSDCDNFGLKPTADFDADRPTPMIVEADPVIAKKERRNRQPKCLRSIHDQFRQEEFRHRKEFKKRMKARNDVLHHNVFYDPIREEWAGWYTSTSFEVAFVL